MTETCCASCKKVESRDYVKLRRCARCKMEFYCGAECQRRDYVNHKYLCRRPDQVIEEEERPSVMGMKNVISLPVGEDVDAEKLMKVIAAKSGPVGKTKQRPPQPKTWSFVPASTPEEQQAELRRLHAMLQESRLSAEQKTAFFALDALDQELLLQVWNLFRAGDLRLPLFRADTRCAREMLRLLVASSPRLGFIGPWRSMPMGDRQWDEEALRHVRKVVAEIPALAHVEDKGMDFTDVAILIAHLFMMAETELKSGPRN